MTFTNALRFHVLLAAMCTLAFNIYASGPITCAPLPLPGPVGDVSALITCIETANALGGGTIDLGGYTYTLTTAYSPAPPEGGAGLPDIASDISIKNGTITAQLGSGFRLLHVSSHLNLHNVRLENGNDQSNYPGAGGGAIYVAPGASIGHINRCHFTANQTYGEGGAIFLGGHVGSIIDSTFTNNSALGLGGGVALDAGIAIDKIERTTFAYNTTVQGIGGGIYITSPLGSSPFTSINTIKDATFADNTANNAGAIYISMFSTIGSVDRCTFSYNGINASNTNGGGGAIVIFGGAITTLSNNTFNNNFAPLAGGALYMNGTAQTVVISHMFNNTFNQNSAYLNSYTQSFGGAMYITGPVVQDMTNNTMAGNIAATAGAGIFNNGTIVNMESNIVAANTVTDGVPFEEDINNYSGGVVTDGFFNLIGSNLNNSFQDGVDGNIVGMGSPIDPQLGVLRDNGGP